MHGGRSIQEWRIHALTIDCWPSFTGGDDASGSFLDPDRWKSLRVHTRQLSELYAIKIYTFSESLTSLLLDSWREDFRGLAKEVTLEGYGRVATLSINANLDRVREWRNGHWSTVTKK